MPALRNDLERRMRNQPREFSPVVNRDDPIVRAPQDEGFGADARQHRFEPRIWIAAEIAARYLERVAKLVLVSSVGIWIRDKPITDVFAEI